MSYDLIVWRHRDGRMLPFNHPDAIAERFAALSHLKGVYPDIDPKDVIGDDKEASPPLNEFPEDAP